MEKLELELVLVELKLVQLGQFEFLEKLEVEEMQDLVKFVGFVVRQTVVKLVEQRQISLVTIVEVENLK